MLPPVLHHETVPAGVVGHVALDNRIVRAVDGQAALAAVVDDVVLEHPAVTRHAAAQVEVERVSTQSALLAHLEGLYSLYVLSGGSHVHHEMAAWCGDERDG